MTFKPYKPVSILALVMLGGLGYAFHAGDFFAEGAILLRMPWGISSLVEIYVGIGLFFCWVFYRERLRGIAFLWLFAALALGNVVACAYVLLAAYRADADPARFFMGHHAVERGNV